MQEIGSHTPTCVLCGAFSSFTDSALSHGTLKGKRPSVLSDGVGVYSADSLILTSVYFIIRHAIARRSEIRATIYKLIEKKGRDNSRQCIYYRQIDSNRRQLFLILYIVDAQRARVEPGGNRTGTRPHYGPRPSSSGFSSGSTQFSTEKWPSVKSTK